MYSTVPSAPKIALPPSAIAAVVGAPCRMMEAVLCDNGFAVKAHTRSFEAVEEFKAGEWDLVVTDIKMPGIDGLEVLQRVKAKDPSMPVIMITAYATVEMSIQALRKGAYDMLTKPFVHPLHRPSSSGLCEAAFLI